MAKSAETTYRALLLNMMVAMMEVDGVIDEREVETIGDVYEEIVGFRLERQARARLIGSVAAAPAQVVEMTAARAHLLDRTRRENLIHFGIRMLRSDHVARPREWRFLRDIGRAVGVTDDEIDRMLG